MATPRKTTARKPAVKKSTESKPSSIKDFKSKSKIKADLVLPSGAVVRVHNRGGMRMFLKSGMIPNGLMGIVQQSIEDGTEPDMKDLFKGADDNDVDMDMVNDMMIAVDNITVECWVLPPVLPIPDDEEDRDEDLLYVDEVLEEDKMFVFQWVTGGTSDLERFREEYQSSVDNLERRSNVGGTRKRASRAKA